MNKRTTFTLIGLLCLFSLNSNAFAGSRYKAVVKKVKNKVEYKYEESSWDTLKLNQVVEPITSIRTGEASKTELMFTDGTVTRVGSNTSFTLLDKKNRAVKVNGTMWFDVKKKSQGLKIYSSNAVAVITGTEGFIEFSGSISPDTEIYTVKDGDTLGSIARKQIGKKVPFSEVNKYIDEILKLNPDVVKNKNLVFPKDKIILRKNTSVVMDDPNASFSLGLIEGTTDVFKPDKSGEVTGEAQKVKEGEVLKIKGGKISRQDLGDFLKIPKNMVIVKGGTFKLGGDGESDEKASNDVNVTSFYISKYEVSQSDYKEIMGNNPSKFIGENLPVENVSWWDAIKYCNKKSINEKLPVAYDESTGELLNADGKVTNDITEVVGYRLPTEAEWEYAAKGAYKSSNFTYSGSNSLDDVSWYGFELSDKTTHPVGTKQANEIGLYDMSGNVSEWVYDTYISDSYKKINESNNTNPIVSIPDPKLYKVYRGGSWNFIPMYQKVVTRSGYIPDYKAENIGFRVVKNLGF